MSLSQLIKLSPAIGSCQAERAVPDVGLVDAHAEADGGHDDGHPALHPVGLDGGALGRLEPGVVRLGWQAPLGQLVGQLPTAVPRAAVHDPAAKHILGK